MAKLFGRADPPVNEVHAEGGSVAVGGGIHDSTIHVGPNEERMRRVFAEELKKSQSAQPGVEGGIDPQVIIYIAARIAPGITNRDQAIIAIDRAVDEFVAFRAQRDAGTNLGNLVDEAVRRIIERIEAEDLEGAQDEGARAFEEWRRRKGEAERQERERREGETAAGITLARETERAAFLSGDAASVAGWVATRLAIEADTDHAPLVPLGEAFKKWRQRGEDIGLNLDLEVAIEIARLALSRQDFSETEIGGWHYNLGVALSTIGRRATDMVRLEGAVTAFRAALDYSQRQRDPLRWAMAQDGLGIALAELGKRESGTARLEEAVQAFRAALEERARQGAEIEWAQSLVNLGFALQMLGDREAGTARLEEAVATHHLAIQILAQHPEGRNSAAPWAGLGGALMSLGSSEKGSATLEKAVAAYRTALEKVDRCRQSFDWAGAQTNLGNALQKLGERQDSKAILEEAVAAHRAALEEWTPEKGLVHWAVAQNNLGNALSAIGEREAGTNRLEEAIAAFLAALEGRTRDRAPMQWAATMLSLYLAQAHVAERLQQPEGLAELERQAREARELLAAGSYASRVTWGDHVLGEIALIRDVLAKDR